MTDGAKAKLVIELTHAELEDAVTEYVVRRYPQTFANKKVHFYVEGDAGTPATPCARSVTVEFEMFFRISKGENP
jgi:hypothetical protein